MIIVKTKEQIEKMKIAGRITGEAILVAAEMIREGVTTKQIDEKIRHHIEKNGAKPSFLGYGGFPGSACISINDEIIHGIPSAERVLHEGDIVKIDVGAFIGGFHGDSANTFPVGKISAEAQHLIDVTKESFYRGVAAIDIEHGRIGDIGHAIDSYVVENGMTTVKKYVGHGVGHDLHEDPNVPNYGTAGRGPRLCRGMTIAIEPMVNLGGPEVLERPDHWTVVTKDGSLSAHYEHSCALTPDGVILLTKVADI
ncbi:MAG: type I methionyl aminopeptidase [Eubacteriales bacterium]|nr:type I methionyl aminopeptidase [Clostridiales bacterium]MDD7773721.1 type I methionyl aminopeptidase [Eubacteriales bacterium]MDY3940897.1 type I methionyl aminopeptidase [Eubacteriales bacterium]